MPLGPRWLRERPFWRPSAERDVDDELAFHLAMRAELYEADGMNPQTARDIARQRFGDVDEVRDRCIAITHERERRMRRIEAWGTARQHARYALRRLRAAPGFTLAVLLMLSLGIGATTAVFSIVNGILLRPLPFPASERLVSLSHTLNVSGAAKVQQSDASVLLYERYATVFDGFGAWRDIDVNLGADGRAIDAERITATGVTSGLFPTLRVAPLHGRVFRPGEDRRGGPSIVVISEALWRRRFGADPAIVGRHVTIDGTSREIVGVMPQQLRFPTAATELWYPLHFDPAHADPGSFNYSAIGRLKSGVTQEGARAHLATILPRLLDEFPGDIPREMFEKAGVRPAVQPLRDVIVGDTSRLLWILLGAVGLLLLVACANVASLFLVRAEGGQRELAVRTALGASRGSVLWQYLSEGIVLAVIGGGVGIGLAAFGVRALGSLPNGVDLPRLAEVSIDGTVLLFSLLATAGCALAVSALPILRARHIPISAVLRESGRSTTTGPDRQRARSTLVVAQIALALVLVAGSGLMARSFARLRDVRPGFDAQHVLTLRLDLPRSQYVDAGAVVRFQDRLLAAARALPGVQSVAITDWIPMTSDHNEGTVMVEDHPLPPNEVPPIHYQATTSRDYFATMRIPVLTGRTFEAHDATRASLEAVVSRAFAERYWKGQNPIGKRLRPGLTGPWRTIVGVVGDVHFDALEKPAEAAIYFPLVTPYDDSATTAPRTIALVVRTAGDASALATPLRGAIRDLDRSLPTYDERPLAAVLRGASARTALTMLLLGMASVIALVLGATGIYGVMAYGVTLRRREIGVRIAIGARPADVSRMISRHGIALAAIGVTIGLVAAVMATRALGTLLYDVSPTDPLTLGGTCVALLGIALLASWLPARRAAAVDPMEALRRE